MNIDRQQNIVADSQLIVQELAIFLFCRYNQSAFPDRIMAVRWTLNPKILVRIQVREPENMKKKIIITVVVVSVLLMLVYLSKKSDKANIIQTDFAPASEATVEPSQPTAIATNSENKNQEERLPSNYLLKVPFASQAPLANWDALHEEACEEASLILIDYFWQKKDINTDLMEKEIIELTNWEQQNGYSQDITIEELAIIAKDKYGYKATVDSDLTENNIKKIISEGKPIIVPLQGQDLGNPYYKQPGPPYHMLVIVGYNKSEFITNDVGTKRGKDYHYKISTLINAAHDWTGSKETVREGKKVMLVIVPA